MICDQKQLISIMLIVVQIKERALYFRFKCHQKLKYFKSHKLSLILDLMLLMLIVVIRKCNYHSASSDARCLIRISWWWLLQVLGVFLVGCEVFNDRVI